MEQVKDYILNNVEAIMMILQISLRIKIKILLNVG